MCAKFQRKIHSASNVSIHDILQVADMASPKCDQDGGRPQQNRDFGVYHYLNDWHVRHTVRLPTISPIFLLSFSDLLGPTVYNSGRLTYGLKPIFFRDSNPCGLHSRAVYNMTNTVASSRFTFSSSQGGWSNALKESFFLIPRRIIKWSEEQIHIIMTTPRQS